MAVVVDGGDESVVVFDVEDRDGIAARDSDLVGRREDPAQGDEIGKVLVAHENRPVAEGRCDGRMPGGVILKALAGDKAHETAWPKVAILATFLILESQSINFVQILF